MKARPGEKLLAAEMITCLVLSWAAVVYRNRGNVSADPLAAAPKPQQFLPQVGAFSALALLALFGDNAEKLAAGLGGLVTLVIVLKAAGILFPAASSSSQPLNLNPPQGAMLA